MKTTSTNTKSPIFAFAAAGALSVGLLSASLNVGCAEKVAGAEESPSESLVKTLNAAKKGDVEAYRKGLSTNFQLVIERYQEMGTATPELKGAFTYETFMRAMALSSPNPKEEIIKGNKAVIKAIDQTGQTVKTDLVLENGTWKLEVPGDMVRGLDHFDEIAKGLQGQDVAPTPDIKVGGGGNADRLKNLPADASDLDKRRAKALDAFDLGDLKGSSEILAQVNKEKPNDEEVVVALGRAYMQQAKGPEAVKLLADFLKVNPASSPARHYIGMAYMFEKRFDLAAGNWRKIAELDPAYAKSFDLEKRANIAEAMHKQRQADPMGEQAPPQGGGAASQPAP